MRTLGVDTGGTFTDLVLLDGDQIRVAKTPSQPDDPPRAVLRGIEALGGVGRSDHVVHGTTVALNALLTGNVARCAFVTNAGFRDLIEIGRQERPDIYALEPQKPTPLAPRSLRFEVGQRSWPDPNSGALREVERPTKAELTELAHRIGKSNAQSVAIGLLHSWADPRIEERLARALKSLDLPLTCSAVLLPEHRESERFTTALVNASLVPLMCDYLGSLEERIGGARLSILQSAGGTLPAARAAVEPARVLLSGPAGGVVGAARAARQAELGRIVTLDMGGTSTDVAFHDSRSGENGDDDEPEATAVEPVRIAGYPVGVPSLDIHTIGCGGGSLVTVDAGGVLHAGPKSAGADPGPVCYGSSDRATVTDAHVLLGHVASGAFLAGELELDLDAVERAFETLAKRLSSTPTRVARAVLEVARAAMRRAVGVMTMQHGLDPAALPLVAFGGAGGLHAAALAESLGMRAALVPARPGLLSAVGMAAADDTRELSRGVLEPLDAWPRRARTSAQRELSDAGREALLAAGHARRAVRFEHQLDLRYQGQSFELRLPDRADVAAAFHSAHERLYGYALPDRPIELVCLRTRARVAAAPPPRERTRSRALPKAAVLGETWIDFGKRTRARRVARAALAPGHRFEGPARIEEYSGTTLVPPGWTARVTAGDHLLLEP